MKIITGWRIYLVATLSMSGIINLGNKESRFCQIMDAMILQDLNLNVSLVRMSMTYNKTEIV